jgi:hypothetical protein
MTLQFHGWYFHIIFLWIWLNTIVQQMVVNLQLSECSVPVLALNHFHLELIYVKLLFLNCTLFTLLVFILFSLASDYFDERKLFLVALSMQIAAISVLTSIGFSWNHKVILHEMFVHFWFTVIYLKKNINWIRAAVHRILSEAVTHLEDRFLKKLSISIFWGRRL